MNKTLKALCLTLAAAALVVAAAITAGTAQPETLPEDSAMEAARDADVAVMSAEKIGWGLGSDTDSLMRPLDALNAQMQYAKYDADFIFDGTENNMVLTFDLGYENGYTESIVDTLNERNVKGIFFITMDYLEDAPEIVEKIIESGHILANHSTTHPSFPDISAEKVQYELEALHGTVQQRYGYTMKLFRFPMGEFSEKKLSEVQAFGYRSVFWSFAYKDWLPDAQPDPDEALKKLTAHAHPGAIYLLHAVSSTNDAILGEFIDRMLAEGYSFDIPYLEGEEGDSII